MSFFVQGESDFLSRGYLHASATTLENLCHYLIDCLLIGFMFF